MIAALAKQYRDELINQIIPFWLKHSKDEEMGGFYTCLDRYGNVFDTDKFMWLQGRETWAFAMFYNEIEQNQAWLQMAEHGADFLKKFGADEDGNFYFSTTRAGKPLVKPYNIFSDCFAAMGFGALHKAIPNKSYDNLAKKTFSNILLRQQNPKGKFNKLITETRELKNFSLPMILCNLSLELEHIIGSDTVDRLAPQVINDVMNVFYDDESGLIRENVQSNGRFSDTFEGRQINPGHGIEAMWFIMDLAQRYNDQALTDKAIDITLNTLDFAWDKEFGGLFYFLDLKGHPPLQLEWDQKLWWVHMETLVSLAKAYQLTNREDCLNWFMKVHDYTWQHFKDPEYAEWFGYLNRRGEVLLPLKGGKWKGCFHVPRGLFQCWKTLEKISDKAAHI